MPLSKTRAMVMKKVDIGMLRRKTCGLVYLVFFGCAIAGCQSEPAEIPQAVADVAFDQDLVDELNEMAKLDQVAASIPQGEHQDLSPEEWKAFKLSTFETHRQRLEEIFDVHGFVGYDKAGKEGSGNFWLITQHSDHDSEFQLRVLEKMKQEVMNDNASSSKYAMLVDRVNLNLGEQQIYGSQVAYDQEICQAYSRDLANKEQVNAVRKQVGLEPIEVYLNEMSDIHFTMNQEWFLKRGITEPKLYSVD